LAEVNIGWKFGDFALGLEETGLQVDDVLAELIVLAYQRLNLILQGLDVLDFFLKLTDICLLALTEGALSGTVLSCTLGSRQFAFSIALGATVRWG
jgi:hypothetical protein